MHSLEHVPKGQLVAMPAIDLRDGFAVQLVGGDFENEKVRDPNPLVIAERFRDAGLTMIHVVDLDAATKRGDHKNLICSIAKLDGISVQVGGGIRETQQIKDYLEAGASRVIVGTRAIEDQAWLEDVSYMFPGRVVVAADVQGRSIVTRGWTHFSGIELSDGLFRLSKLPLAAILITAVHVEGQLKGIDATLFEEAVWACPNIPIIASGGITTTQDLVTLASQGARGAVLGMALYTRALSMEDVARRFGPKNIFFNREDHGRKTMPSREK